MEHKCQNMDCGKPAPMACPTCIKIGREPSFFCSQECFKSFFPVHKLLHVKKEDQSSNQNQKKDNFRYTGPLRPGNVAPRRQVPDHIKKPDYAKSGIPSEEMQQKNDKHIPSNDEEDIKKLRECAIIARKALDVGHRKVAPGVTTDEIDVAVHDFIISQNAYPSPLNYHGFPKSLCT